MSLRKVLFLCILAMWCASVQAQTTITTFILVRHAEKASDGSDDPDLRAEGVERAGRLITLLEKTKLDAIYSTSFKRTRNTVTPLAEANHLRVGVYEAFKSAPIEQMLKDHSGGTVVVCGHSNNIPWIANLLTGDKQIPDYEDGDYGNVLIVSVLSPGKVSKITWLRY